MSGWQSPNMRRFYPSVTMRNFSLYVSPEADMRLGPYSLEELVQRVHHSMQMEVDRRELSRQITRNVGAELRPVVRATPFNLYFSGLLRLSWSLVVIGCIVPQIFHL